MGAEKPNPDVEELERYNGRRRRPRPPPPPTPLPPRLTLSSHAQEPSSLLGVIFVLLLVAGVAGAIALRMSP